VATRAAWVRLGCGLSHAPEGWSVERRQKPPLQKPSEDRRAVRGSGRQQHVGERGHGRCDVVERRMRDHDDLLHALRLLRLLLELIRLEVGVEARAEVLGFFSKLSHVRG